MSWVPVIMMVVIGVANLIARLGAAKKKAEQAKGGAHALLRPRAAVNVSVSRAEPADQVRTVVSQAMARGSEAMEQATRALERRLDMMVKQYEPGRSSGASPRPPVAPSPPASRVTVVPVPPQVLPTKPRSKVSPPASVPRIASPIAGAPAASSAKAGSPGPRRRGKVRRPWTSGRLREGLIAGIVLAPPPSVNR
jgi:hypothetical protein